MRAQDELQALLPHWDITVKDSSANGRLRAKLSGAETLCLDRGLIQEAEIARDSVLSIVAREISDAYPELVSELGRRFTDKHLENVGYIKEAAEYRAVKEKVLAKSYAEEGIELKFDRDERIVTAVWKAAIVINGVVSNSTSRFLCRSFEKTALQDVLRELIPQVRSGKVSSGEIQEAA
nr:hypothetical protein BdHM001_35730 [Bdellovibrio sp. HM001]